MKTHELTLDEAYQRLYPLVYQYILTRCSCGEGTADAITADVFYTLHLKWSSLRSHHEKVLTTWVLRAASLLIRKHQRINAKRLALHDDRTEAALAELASDENVALDVEAAERYETLLKTVQAALTPSEWALFEDHYIRGLSNQEIAKNLGITPHALEQRRSRLKKKLRGILSNPSDKHSYHGNII